MSVLSRRVPTWVHPAGVATTEASALLLVTKRSSPSVSRTALGIVTRWVIWFAAIEAPARNVMLSAAAAGDVTSPIIASNGD